MQIGIIQFPGTNCERETALAIKRANMQPVEFLWNEPRSKLAEMDGYILAGGFSYEDRSRAGIIAALDPLMKIIIEQSERGKPVLGICNGAQILVEAGLVPGLEKNKLGLALTDNKRVTQDGKLLGTGFYNAWITLRLAEDYQYNAFTRRLSPKNILRLPIAHGEGRFVIPPGLLSEMKTNGLHVFQYCNAQGEIVDAFPVNPNGSIANIAAISNKAGNVMAMMPHPERTSEGDAIFHSMREFIQENKSHTVSLLHYVSRYPSPKKYFAEGDECVVESLLTDNHALSVEAALAHLNIPVKVKRQVHWEMMCNEATAKKIQTSEVLFNPRKEKMLQTVKSYPAQSFLVRAKDDMQGAQTKQLLEHHFGITGLKALHHGVLWHLSGVDEAIEQVLLSHILFNPYAHDYYRY